ncbi:hypothetical protein GMDG_05220 [Pseudogymnoascus destructans 20631-21]|uniref:Uncharacterized protein n=1 Tax=Pseudogymnoascus destructans (strain ATCC MYA-4855 / 20631-21) TaxID=658429 RepID=L8FNE9_PSED2|nr:hypothetical protein GMDG_05220 [Pseudogymnoascus destructans 20631-21]
MTGQNRCDPRTILGPLTKYVAPCNLHYSAGPPLLVPPSRRLHPSLGISVLGASTQTPSWNPLESIDLSSLVTFAEPNASVEEYLIKLYNTPILSGDGTSPLWRALVIPLPPVAMNGTPEAPAPFRLTIGDGLSGAAVLQTCIQHALLAALHEPSSNQPTTVQPSSADLPPAFETTVPLSITGRGFLRTLYETVFLNRDVWSVQSVSVAGGSASSEM